MMRLTSKLMGRGISEFKCSLYCIVLLKKNRETSQTTQRSFATWATRGHTNFGRHWIETQLDNFMGLWNIGTGWIIDHWLILGQLFSIRTWVTFFSMCSLGVCNCRACKGTWVLIWTMSYLDAEGKIEFTIYLQMYLWEKEAWFFYCGTECSTVYKPLSSTSLVKRVFVLQNPFYQLRRKELMRFFIFVCKTHLKSAGYR